MTSTLPAVVEDVSTKLAGTLLSKLSIVGWLAEMLTPLSPVMPLRVNGLEVTDTGISSTNRAELGTVTVFAPLTMLTEVVIPNGVVAPVTASG